MSAWSIIHHFKKSAKHDAMIICARLAHEFVVGKARRKKRRKTLMHI